MEVLKKTSHNPCNRREEGKYSAKIAPRQPFSTYPPSEVFNMYLVNGARLSDEGETAESAFGSANNPSRTTTVLGW